MKKLIFGILAVAAMFASFAVAPAADASSVTTATFTAVQPAGQFSQFNNVWTHVFSVTVNADNSFSGTGLINGADGTTTFQDYPETVHGTLNATGDIATLVVDGRADGVVWSIDNPVDDGIVVNLASLSGNPDYLLEFIITKPVLTTVVTPEPVLGNHGDCVSGAAHAGIKGKTLADIAKVVTKVGAYGSMSCPAV